MVKVLIIEDSEETVELLKVILRNENNIEIYEASSVKEGMKIITLKKPNIILLDLNLPDGNGSYVCEKLRKNPTLYNNPFILAITAETSQSSINKNLELGCDDYIKKPFNQKELLIRIKKFIKRVPEKKQELTYEKINVNLKNKNVVYDTDNVTLSKNEFKLLTFFIVNKGILLNREKILDHVWDDNLEISNKAVDQCLKRLRKKIPLLNDALVSKRGFGYILK
ncbi:response regulator transcription factor [Ilyobacter polytropus]|uniref:Two component transcriptional regulator, winged helix family n=1 Tax=Ilyobacter polytropus (strain ATCC 51220 / DSM 2926 / LMG 16218 / CuHBu1) TaxID=572544 RepID=E3HDA0_ILYPC|nr:response regulator transcription factor [Ilyobacter polytropus]ADO84100.1 two component transcriptional regulator, winged helix family [Ilyobacter polytropus DSM 2926]